MTNNPVAWILICAAIIAILPLPLVWKRREAAGARWILVFLAAVIVWNFSYALELFQTNVESMLFLTHFEYPGIVTAPVCVLLFAISYTGFSRKIPEKWRHWWLLFIEPVFIVLMQWTTSLHGLHYQHLSTEIASGHPVLKIVYGPLFYIHIAYSYLMLIAGTALFIRYITRSPRMIRGQVNLLMVGLIIPWLGNILWVARLTPVDLTPAAFAVCGLVLSLAIYRFQLFNIIPIARETAFEKMSDAVVVVNPQEFIVDANQAARNLLANNDEIEIIGRTLKEVAGGQYAKLIERFSEMETRMELDLGTDDMPNWHELVLMPLFSTNQQFAGRLITFHRINERKQAEMLMAEARDQAVQSSMLKSQLLANVSHELRTPLGAILGYAEMLDDGAFGTVNEEQATALKNILYSTNQMTLFVNDLLDQSLIEKGKMSIRYFTLSPQDIVNAARALTIQNAENRGLELSFEIDPALPDKIVGDPKRLQQVLVNLINNALKFTDKGAVRVKLDACGEGQWAIQVSDTGIGISKEALGFIFEPFRQVENTSRKHSGAGLGLSIVKHLVTLMNGRIEVESELGKGSVFRVILPVIKPEE